ncbi:dihydrodipicolinate synthase family protein [Paenibacillus oryzisoli]|uniref:dihydrodipicolinate synthase family protein n=1 Tax=Paenibacillus oryzisoli TaxID=1850517 RepID=UPI003D2BAEE4
MPGSIRLPNALGEIVSYQLQPQRSIPTITGTLQSRTVFSAAHVVSDPLADMDPLHQSALDWELTLAYRRYLWSLGLSVAEAMDTAQRGMGLTWETSKELIRLSVREAQAVGGKIACGAGTDHLSAGPTVTIADVERAYEEQVAYIEGLGGQVILMASRALARCAQSPEDYMRVYGKILSQVSQPVILHWLGDMFDPNLKGYWGHEDLGQAMEVCLQIIHEYQGKIDGIKISLLDAEKEIEMRRRLPESVRMYTGDDFNYPSLIKGDEQGYSHALLGIFDAIAPVAAASIQAMDHGNLSLYDELLDPTVELSRHIFQKPTFAYKTGIVFMAYLNGHQPHFRMVGGAEGARSIVHLSKLFVLADQAGLLRDSELAMKRMRNALILAGIE